MFYLDRRFFLKKTLGFGVGGPIGVVINQIVLNDFNDNFICEDFYLMGTRGKVQIFCDNLEHGRFLIKQSISRIGEIEACLTKFSPYSDIGRINNNSHKFNEVSFDTLNVLNLGKRISAMTFGYFDMGLGNILSYSGIDKFVPIVGHVTSLCDMSDDLFSSSGNYVKLTRNNSMIDLGGIGKGFALDECIKIFMSGGIKHVAIEFGGDIRVFGGMPNGMPWRVVFDRRLYNFLNDEFSWCELYSGSLAVSGGYLKKSCFNKYHHIIDPFSLMSKNNYSILLVKGSECVYCDALSTACFNMERDMIKEVSKKFGEYSFKIFVL